jgi:hypothetical protein
MIHTGPLRCLSWNIPKISPFVSWKKSLKIYYDLTRCCIMLLCKYMFKKFLQICHIWRISAKIRICTVFLKHWLQWLTSVFEYFILIRFISKHITCFHNILKTLSCQHKRKIGNINTIFYVKTWKFIHWLHLLWYVLSWLHPHEKTHS